MSQTDSAAPAAAQAVPAVTAQEAHELLREVVQGWRLNHEQASMVSAALGASGLSEAETAALLAALHARGEKPQKVVGAASVFRQAVQHFPLMSSPLTDVVDTEGDGVGTINISTGADPMAASMGVAMAKHGSRAVPSKTKAVDVITELELPLDVGSATVIELLARDHFTFLFAQAYRPTIRHVVPVHKALATPTIFSVLGSLMNPVHLTFQLMGVQGLGMLDMIAETMVQPGRERVLVVRDSGLDGIAIHGPILMREATPDGVRVYEIASADLGASAYEPADLLSGEPAGSAHLLCKAVSGRGRPAHYDVVTVNAGALLYLTDRADSFADGTTAALEQILSDGMARHLESMTKASDLTTETA